MSENLGEALLILRTDDRGLDAGIANAKPKAEALGKTLDNTADSAEKLGKSMDVAGASATKYAAHQNAVTTSAAAQKAGISQLMMQVNDAGTMYAMGARPMQIFTSQMGQVLQAVQLASGGTSKFATIMGSPWTMAIGTAAIVLLPLITGLFDTEEASDKAGKASETLAERLDRSKHSAEEVRKALREYNAEQKKAAETTLEKAAAVAVATAEDLKAAIATRERLKADLEFYRAEAQRGATSEATDVARQGAFRRAGELASRIAQEDAEIARLTQEARDSVGGVAEELAKLQSDPTENIKLGFRGLRDEAKATIKDVDALTKRLAELDRQEKAALDKANKAARESQSAGRGNTAPGDATRFISPVSGGRITGSFGEHRGNRDHAGIDIAVPVGTQVKAPAGGVIIEAGNVPGYGNVVYIDHGRGTISRLAHLSQIGVSKGDVVDQGAIVGLSGGARGAPGSGNSRGPHLHQEVRVNGRPVNPSGGTFQTDPSSAQDKAEKLAEQAARDAEKEARRVERYTRDLAGLQDAAADLQARLTETAEERFELESQGLDIAQAEARRRIEANADYTAAEKEQLLAALAIKESLERELLDRRRREELARQALEIAQAMNANEAELLQKQRDLANTRAERRDIDQQLLELGYRDRRMMLEARAQDQSASDSSRWAAYLELLDLDKNKALDQERLDRDNESPLERYKRELVGFGANLNDELEEVAVNGLDMLSDRLADVVMNAKSMGDAIVGVFRQIGAELLRLAIQQELILPLINALKGAPGGGTFLDGLLGNGSNGAGAANAAANIAAGFGKFSGMFADGGLIPSGGWGIVGEAGPEPVFATGGGIGVMPNSAFRSFAAAMGGGGGGSPYFDLRGALVTSDLLRQMNAIMRGGIAAYDEQVAGRVSDHQRRRGQA